ncbi:MAG: GntR family transcriptional regulator [Clostridia bacterium]|nr:GntR family transcriptional regulator [Clostridia bacterium]
MINIDYRDARPIYEQVKDSFKNLIFHGILKQDEKIPAVRELAGELAINPNTIQRAYKELEAEGYIYSVKGKGTFIAEPLGREKQEQKEKLMESLHTVLDELFYLGITKDEIIGVIERRNEND